LPTSIAWSIVRAVTSMATPPTTSRSASLAQKCAQFLGDWQGAYPLSEPAVAAAAAAYSPSGQHGDRGTGSLTAATGTITAKSNKDGTKTAVTINYHA